MSVIFPPESEYAKERVKWEAQGSSMGPGLRPYQFRQLPTWMFLGGRPQGGLGAHTIVEQELAETEGQVELFRQRGFRPTPLEAIEAFKAQHVEYAKLAAERNYDVKNRLSAKASAEVAAAEEAHDGFGHMPMVPETPIKRRVSKARKSKES